MKIVRRVLIFLLLTILTQIGGLIYFLSILTYPFIQSKFTKKFAVFSFKLGTFILLYLTLSFTFIPFLASKFGRVPLPIFDSAKGIKPNSIVTCLLNRHYVRKEMRQTLDIITDKMSKNGIDVSIYYLDASFPFINGFPLVPHLSHNDGRKLDLTYYYTDDNTHQELPGSPSWLGYGFCEEPSPNEICTPCDCQRQGFYQYSMLKYLVPESLHKRYKINTSKTAQLIRTIASEPNISMIFIEPHLKSRWGLTDINKIHFHGCHAVRHDDHIHIQIY